MWLMGIHNPDALWHYTGYTYCPCVGKEGQNEGTLINHLRTTHYRLGLVCGVVFWLPNNDVRLSLPAWMPKLSMILCCFWIRSVQLTHLPNQEFTQGSKGGAIQLDPLPSRRPEDSMKKVLPTKSIFYYLASPTRQLFYSSCDQDCLRKMLLITSSTLTQTDYS